MLKRYISDGEIITTFIKEDYKRYLDENIKNLEIIAAQSLRKNLDIKNNDRHITSFIIKK